MSIAGFFLKACLVVLAIICSPVLFVLAIVFVALVIAAIAVAIGGGAALYQMLPSVDWSPLISTSPDDDYRREHCRSCLGRYSFSRHYFRDSPANLQLVSYVIRLKWSLLIIWILAVRYFCHQPLLPGMAYPFLWVG